MNRLVLILLFLCTSVIGNAGLFEHFTKTEGLKSNTTYNVAQDAQGRIWVAETNSMCVFDGFKFDCHEINLPIPGDKLVGVLLSSNKKLFCYSLFGSILVYDKGSFKPIITSEKNKDLIKKGLVNNVVCDDECTLYITMMFNGDLVTIDPIKGELSQIIMPSLSHKYYIFEISEDAFITLNASEAKQNRVFYHGLDTNISFSLSGGAGFSKSNIVRLRDSSMLYSKDYELVHFNKHGVISRIFLEKSIECFLQDRDNNIWVGLNNGGLVKFDKARITRASRTNYIINKSVTGLHQDNTGDLWITTSSHGVYFLPSQSKIYYKVPNIYSSSGDSMNVEISTPENVKYREISSHQLGKSGFEEQVAPSVYISGVSILNQDTTVLPFYDLDYDQNFVRISFAGISPIQPELLQFKYKLDGVNLDWVYTSNYEIQYTTLPPGKYKFEVSAMNTSGVWSEKLASISFKIHYPFWQTWWFISILIFSAIAITIGIIQISRNQIRKKERQRFEIDKKIANLELQALRAQMNPHFIFNTISSIQYFITANETKPALRYLTKFAKLMRSIMENSKQPRVTIKNELNAIELYLQLESMRFDQKFNYSIDLDPEIDPDFDQIPPMLIQPYIENALNHGILNMTGKGSIDVSLVKGETHFISTIKDNGIGRVAAEKIKAAKKHKHKSRGMSITKSRLEIINKLDYSEMNVKITDLYDENNSPCGTEVMIYMPIKTEHYEE